MSESFLSFFYFLFFDKVTAHVFPCEFWKIKNIIFVEQLRTAASKHWIYIFFFVLNLLQNRCFPLNSGRIGANPVLKQIGTIISVWFLYRTRVRALSTNDIIRYDTIRYHSAYYIHVNTSSTWNLKIKSPKINCWTLIKTVLNSLKIKETNKTNSP